MDRRILALFLVCLSISALTGFELIQVLATPSPTINKVVTPGADGPCTWFFSLDGTTPVARAMVGGLSVSPGDNIVGTAGQDFGAFLATNAASAQSAYCFAMNTVYTLTTTWTVPSDSLVQGGTPGHLWNGIETSGVELKCNLSSNNVPCLKFADNSEGITINGIKLFYTGAATGTDGLFIDGTTVNRHHRFYGLDIQGFSGYCLHTSKTAFDIKQFGGGYFNCALGNIFQEAAGGTPTQMDFFGTDCIINTATKYCITVQGSQFNWHGGNIANGLSGGNGIDIQGVNGAGILGTDLEGAGIASTIGVRYTGSQLTIDGATRILSWNTNFQVGQSTSAQARNWYVNANFGSPGTEDVKITAGGSRDGILGPQSMSSIATITNTRASSDGVYVDLTEWWEPSQQPAPATVSTPATGNAYQNQDFYNEAVYAWCGTCTAVNITLTRSTGTGVEVCNAFPCTVILPPGWKVYMTYATSTPTMRKSYAGP